METEIVAFLAKAEESLATADSEFANLRYNSCANRCYYACFQAAVAALVRGGIRPRDPRGQWGHDFVQAQFAGEVVGHRHRYPAELRTTLDRLFTLRQTADYRPDPVTETEANRAVRRARAFVRCHPAGRGCSVMTHERHLLSDPRMQAAIAEVQGLIRSRYPEATFAVGYGEDPAGVYLRATVDVEDRDEVVDVFIDRLVDLHIEEQLPLHVLPVRPPERNAAILRGRTRPPRPAQAVSLT